MSWPPIAYTETQATRTLCTLDVIEFCTLDYLNYHVFLEYYSWDVVLLSGDLVHASCIVDHTTEIIMLEALCSQQDFLVSSLLRENPL